jgi:hypothetical protein
MTNTATYDSLKVLLGTRVKNKSLKIISTGPTDYYVSFRSYFMGVLLFKKRYYFNSLEGAHKCFLKLQDSALYR